MTAQKGNYEVSMSLLSGDPLTQLAFSVYENKGVYALLVGSGLSRAADIPTGWEITLDLVRRVAAAQGVEDQDDWQAWYQETTDKDPSYSELVGELGLSRDERRSILHSYIEPDDDDREEGRKLPTRAHHAIARLVREGYIRVIITTNFDRLLENALREQGIEPTVVASVDALQGAEPLTHTSCYLFKLHGDYKDARILNTDEELTAYPPEYDGLLDRIIDEHGLVVCGWSGEWDHALRASILRAPARRYPLFWATRGGRLGDGAQEIADHRDARIIPIDDADRFFTGLEQRVETLARTHRQNPVSVDLLVNAAKRYLAKPEQRIQLDELFTTETRNLIEKIEAAGLAPQGQFSADEFQRRIALYESFAEPLARMAGVLGRWGDGSEFSLIGDVIKGLCAHADREGAGLKVWLVIRTYPAVLAMTGYGLGLVRAGRWRELHRLFSLPVNKRHDPETKRAVQRLFLWAWEGGNNDYWKQLEGLDDRKTALSDHLCDLFAAWSKSFVGVLPDFERLYESWEILGSLTHLECAEKDELDAALAEEPRNGWIWCPVGRSGWHHDMRQQILEDFLNDATKREILEAGFAKGDEEFLQKAVENYRRLASRMEF
ncbi:SIR2 family protein [Rhodovulum adriaticum]|nr:SIR2 family protein [Rhodovulum adriaticum]